jgi:hypothetical protein
MKWRNEAGKPAEKDQSRIILITETHYPALFCSKNPAEAQPMLALRENGNKGKFRAELKDIECPDSFDISF